jgi:hypothetical protein
MSQFVTVMLPHDTSGTFYTFALQGAIIYCPLGMFIKLFLYLLDKNQQDALLSLNLFQE